MEMSVGCTPRPLYPREVRPWYQLGGRMGKPQVWSGLSEKRKKKSPAPAGIRTHNPQFCGVVFLQHACYMPVK